MNEFQLSKGNLEQFFNELQAHLNVHPNLLIKINSANNTGKWGMARLWRSWMETTAVFMAAQGVKQPLMTKANGEWYGSRPFNKDDAHELFTAHWLGVDKDGNRLSWSKKGREGLRPATKAERFHALRRHEIWAIDKGLNLFKPRDSEYELLKEQMGE